MTTETTQRKLRRRVRPVRYRSEAPSRTDHAETRHILTVRDGYWLLTAPAIETVAAFVVGFMLIAAMWIAAGGTV